MIPRTLFLSSVGLAVLAACSPTQPTPPAPTLTVSPATITATAGDAPTALTATVTDSTADVTWALAGDGTLSGTTGKTVNYTPPATLGGNSSALISATLGGTNLVKTITVSLKPKPVTPTLDIIAPSQPIVFNTEKVAFNANVTGGSNSQVQWSLDPATGAGSIDPAQGGTTLYTPPLSGTANQTVTLKAKLGTLEKTYAITVLLPTLSVGPNADPLNAGLKKTFTASLNNRDNANAVQWTLEGIGGLNGASAKAATGASVEYNAPDPATVITEQTVRLTAKSGSVSTPLEFKVRPTVKQLTLSTDPANTTDVYAGQNPITVKLLRTLIAADAAVSFSVDPSSKGGSISVVNANTYLYTPPAPADVTAANTPVTLTFSADGVSKTLTLNLKPKPVLVVTPSSGTVNAGGAAITLTAGRTNLDPAKAITYTVTSTTPGLPTGATGNTVTSSAPGDTATYTPPSSVTADTTVVITATTGTAPSDAITTITLTVKPKPATP